MYRSAGATELPKSLAHFKTKNQFKPITLVSRKRRLKTRIVTAIFVCGNRRTQQFQASSRRAYFCLSDQFLLRTDLCLKFNFNTLGKFLINVKFFEKSS